MVRMLFVLGCLSATVSVARMGKKAVSITVSRVASSKSDRTSSLADMLLTRMVLLWPSFRRGRMPWMPMSRSSLHVVHARIQAAFSGNV